MGKREERGREEVREPGDEEWMKAHAEDTASCVQPLEKNNHGGVKMNKK